ncbi:homoserine O-acetyltransferase MetX [Sporolituus thermophilus]|uniref:Homoserine O-acetyltransferase n=1 Tax=Sporolituus thermophilus DSM 23256 TaxID=1123285 RepID=A0A1G7K5Z6_9FIRM|nr:homoserine O-acetyltransferase [Sporolituus thermophilus]SDF32556.1 homoserine O-acetyltransferase [Sporolituus thermophilus DSM 23256]
MRPFLKYAKVADPDNPLVLTMGGTLTDVTVAYETYGTLSPNRDNVILVAHALTGDSHVAAHDDKDEKGWWDALVGPGRPIDTNRFFVICSNVLGGCRGTTGPSSPDPATGRPYGMRFPAITIRDMVHVQKRLLEQLDIYRLALVIGGSMGGMQALEWGVTYPGFMDGIIAIAAPGYSSAQSIAYNKVAREAVMLDPAWRQGDYYGGAGPQIGLSIARALGMITYQSEPSMAAKFGRRMRGGQFEVENYLDYQGISLVRRFDANSYLYLLRALDLHDLGAGYASYEAALARIEARVLIVGVSSDILYPAYQQQELVEVLRRLGKAARYAQIDSPHGHDGFLIDFDALSPVLSDFINTIAPPVRLPWAQSFFRASSLAYFGARLVPEF